MTPDEAINNLNELRTNKTLCYILSKQLSRGQFKSIQLGIEGLERLQMLRKHYKDIQFADFTKLLPSETEE